jgi:4-amino-4-deoxy-L-arabinose transferase-like glycosyltransferase
MPGTASITGHTSVNSWAALNRWLQAHPLRALLAFVGAQVLIWTFVPWALGRSLPLDVVSDGLSWGHEWQWGYYKHPPLPSWEVEAAFDLLGDIGPYLLSQLAIAATFVFVFLLGRRMMPMRCALAGTVLLSGLYYFSLPTPEFNHNVAQMPLWAAAAYFYYEALKKRSLGFWALLGLAIGLGMLTKYSTAIFAATIIIHALSSRSTRAVFASIGPYLAVIVCLAVMTPHLIWLAHNNFPTLHYAANRAGHAAALQRVLTPLRFLVAQMATLLPCIAIAAIIGAVGLGTWRDRPWFEDEDFRFLVFLCLGPAILSALLSLAAGLGLRDMWGVPMWNLTGLLLVNTGRSRWEKISLGRLFVCAAVLFVVLPITYEIANTYGPEWRGSRPRTQWPDRTMANELSTVWTKATGSPLQIVTGDSWIAGLIAMRCDPRPSVFIDATYQHAPWISPERLRRQGALVVWQISKKTPTPPAELMLPGIRLMGAMDFPWPYSNKVEPLHIGWAIVQPIQSAAPARQ